MLQSQKRGADPPALLYWPAVRLPKQPAAQVVWTAETALGNEYDSPTACSARLRLLREASQAVSVRVCLWELSGQGEPGKVQKISSVPERPAVLKGFSNLKVSSNSQWVRRLQARDFQDLPIWKTGELLSWFIEENLPPKFYCDEEDPASFGLASLGFPLSFKRERWASSWVGGNAWMLNQLRQSPMRVSRREDADMIFIPVMFRFVDDPNDDLQVS